MIQVTFVGVGEAFDETLPNTSLLVMPIGKARKHQILLDCGFTAAHAFWYTSPDPLGLDAVWISHYHGDHFFGLPLLLLRFFEEQRTGPLTIIGQAGVEEKVLGAMELAYPGFFTKAAFSVEFVEAIVGQDLHLFDLNWSFAPNQHPKPCLALRLDSNSTSLFYSGDGRPSPETEQLARGCNLVIHEAFGLTPMIAGHGSVDGCIDFAAKTGTDHLALVHMNRDVRRLHGDDVRRRLAGLKSLHAFLPDPGDTLTIGGEK